MKTITEKRQLFGQYVSRAIIAQVKEKRGKFGYGFIGMNEQNTHFVIRKVRRYKTKKGWQAFVTADRSFPGICDHLATFVVHSSGNVHLMSDIWEWNQSKVANFDGLTEEEAIALVVTGNVKVYQVHFL